MGRSTETDVVPFVIHNIYYTNNIDHENDFKALFDFEEDEPQEVKGWILEDTCVMIGKRKRLYADMWKKGNYTVFIVNEAQWSNGGEYDMAVISNDKNSLKVFLKDWRSDIEACNGNTRINTLDSVSQTL